MGRTLLLLFMTLTVAEATAAGEPSPRRGGFLLLGGGIGSPGLHVEETGQPDHDTGGTHGYWRAGVGYHFGPRLSLTLEAEGWNDELDLAMGGVGFAWYPAGWGVAGGDLFLRGRVAGVFGDEDALAESCPDRSMVGGTALAAGLGWDRVLHRSGDGSARWSLQLSALLQGVAARLEDPAYREPEARISGVIPQLGASVVWSPWSGGQGAWDEEPAIFGISPFIGMAGGWGAGMLDLTDADGATQGYDEGGLAGGWRLGVSLGRSWWAYERTRWAHDGDLADPDLVLGRLLIGVGLGRRWYLEGGIGGFEPRVDATVGDCENLEGSIGIALSVGVGYGLLVTERWTVAVRTDVTIQGMEYHAVDADLNAELRRKWNARLVTVGLTVDWNLLPLQRD